jgi:peptidyl-prolyl cis-trans isomerase A (cyclophilin A)
MTLRSVTLGIGLAVAIAIPPALGAQTPKTPPADTKPAPAQGTKPKPKPVPGAKSAPAQRGRGPAKPAEPQLSAAAKARLRTPARLNETAPATYNARFETSVGPFVVQVHREWAPKGADRFYNLVKNGFYDGARFFRVLPNFMAQFGINGDPSVQRAWRAANITDDPVTQSNRRGSITFATAGPGTRTTQVFINFANNARLDRDGFAPFGEVVSGMEVVDKINAEYKQMPDQGRIQAQGNGYLNREFPRLDYIKKAAIEAQPKPGLK